MTITSSITNAVVIMVIVVVIVGMALGLGFSGNDLLNPVTSAGKREQMAEDTRHDHEMNRIEEERAHAENEYLIKKREHELAFLPIRNYVLTVAAALALVIITIGVAIFGVKLGNRWSSSGQTVAPLTADQGEDIWKIQAYRDARIQAAQANERFFREAFAQRPGSQAQSFPIKEGYREEAILYPE